MGPEAHQGDKHGFGYDIEWKKRSANSADILVNDASVPPNFRPNPKRRKHLGDHAVKQRFVEVHDEFLKLTSAANK